MFGANVSPKNMEKASVFIEPIAAGYLPGAYSVPIDLSYWTFSLFAIFRVSRWCCTLDHIEQALNFNEVALISVQQHYMNLCFA